MDMKDLQLYNKKYILIENENAYVKIRTDKTFKLNNKKSYLCTYLFKYDKEMINVKIESFIINHNIKNYLYIPLSKMKVQMVGLI